jgi:hypothetical protein
MAKTTSTTAEIGLFDGAILKRAAGQAVLKLNSSLASPRCW